VPGAGRGRRAVPESAGVDCFWLLSLRTCHCLRACHSECSEGYCPLTGAPGHVDSSLRSE
jgi:hypothetical protein